MTLRLTDDKAASIPWQQYAPLLVGAAAYLIIVAAGHNLLGDADTYWHLTIGRSILSTWQFPTADTYSFTVTGHPWVAQEWLSDVLFAAAWHLGGWTAMAALAAAAAALALAFLTRWLTEELTLRIALILVAGAFMLATPHLTARPHVLAWPAIVIWVAGVVRAVDRKGTPSYWLLPVLVLWANLHGGFTFGLLVVAGAALDAVTATPKAERKSVALAWLRFGVLAIVAAMVTPYGPESFLVTVRILSLGDALSIISEWQPADFSQIGGLEVCLLFGVGLILWTGFTMRPVRILTLLVLIHLALSAARNNEMLGLLAPIVLAAPLAAQFPAFRARQGDKAGLTPALGLALLLVAVPATAVMAQLQPYAPGAHVTPSGAVDAVKTAGAKRVFNDYDLGGYLIYSGVPTFIDGRSELFGRDFILRYVNDAQLRNIPDLIRLLDEYDIDATLLRPSTPAVGLLDRLPGWQRTYSDDVAVVHTRLKLRTSRLP